MSSSGGGIFLDVCSCNVKSACMLWLLPALCVFRNLDLISHAASRVCKEMAFHTEHQDGFWPSQTLQRLGKAHN